MESIGARRGKRVDTWFRVAKKPDGSDYSIPLTIVQGTEEGPVLYVQGGVHADELEGPAAIMDVVNMLDVTKLKGTFIGLTVANVAAYLHKISADVSGVRENPYDGKNLNGVFPGKIDGTVSERIAYTISERLLPLADVAIDIHSGGQRGTSLHMAGFIAEEHNIDYMLKTLEIAELFPMKIIWKNSPLDKLNAVAQEKKVPIVCVEVTGQGRCEDRDVAPIVIGIQNVMKHLGMLDGKLEGLPKERKYIDTETYIYAKIGGLLRPKVDTGDHAKNGQVLGIMYDVHGHVTEEVKAPFDCIITGVRTKGVAWVGEPVFLISSYILSPREMLTGTKGAKPP